MHRLAAIALALAAAPFLPNAAANANPPAAPDPARLYTDSIKPVLKERCYACHGALKQKADLRLDTALHIRDAGILSDGELLARVTSADPDERMPPEGAPLEPGQIDSLRRWIEAGSPAPEAEAGDTDPRTHWAFQPIARPPLPPGNFPNPIDAFLAAKYRQHGLEPQPEADPSILLRRLYLDLTGLPPTADQLATSDPFEVTVDQLLKSPHHGERWARHWMDVWRYTDWYGLDAQLRHSQKHIWRWRDWIVSSLNADKGYHRMLSEMLAGDEIDPQNPDALAATGFLARNYYLFNRTTWLDDTIEHSAKAFLGLTMNCAKCHDHKYDPISQEDYYRFRAIFEPHQVRLDPVPGSTDFEHDGLPRAFDDQPDAETFLHIRGDPANPDKTKKITPGVPAIFASFAPDPEPVTLPVEAWAPGLREHFQNDLLAAATAKLADATAKLESARSELASAPPAADPDKATEETAAPVLFSDPFDHALPDAWKTEGAAWSYREGKLVHGETVQESRTLRSLKPHPADFDLTLHFRTTGGGTYKSVGVRFDSTAGGQNNHTIYASAHAPGPKVQIAHTSAGTTAYPAHGKVDRPIKTGEDYSLRVQVRGTLANVSLNGAFLLAYTLPHRHPDGAFEIFAFDATAEFDSLELRTLPPDTPLQNPATQPAPAPPSDPDAALKLAEARHAEADTNLRTLRARIAADIKTIRGTGPGDPATAARLERELAVATARRALLEAAPDKRAAAEKSLAEAEKALGQNGTNYSPLRGSFKALETPEHKEPQYPSTYTKISTGRRSALARWITARENPLTARVAVNHIWMRHFGEPLVENVSDFGRSTPVPKLVHLLDFLAAEFIDSGWSMKHLHRLIVTSQAYRRSSSNLGAQPATLAQDPQNHLLWRMHPRRMESQVVRDSLLHLAGQLDLTTGGPSVDPAPESRRRSLYFKHSPDQQSLLLATFDDAEILACYRRSESIVPQQALALTNSKLALDSSSHIASSLASHQDDAAFADAAFARILCRKPNPAESAACLDFLKQVPDRARLVHALINHNDFVTIR